MEVKFKEPTVAIIGLGYVGLPLALSFSQCLKVIGFDTNKEKIAELKRANKNSNLVFTAYEKCINKADFIIIAVPTLVMRTKEPDLSYIISAGKIIARNMKIGCTVVLESTVYPGVTEEILKPVIEGTGMVLGRDFNLAYSPERINPGDDAHSLIKVTKVVSATDLDTTELVAQLYLRICPNVFKAKDIKTAEASKIIENTQRDVNIALINELSIIFNLLGLNTKEVLKAAATKWNFQPYSPGLVGGHCIPVVPYFLVHKAQELGYSPKFILAGRATNDYMPEHITGMTIKALCNAGKIIKDSKILIMGLTYKENVADSRESPIREVIKGLQEFGIEIWGHDPLVKNIKLEFGINYCRNLKKAHNFDCIILALAHTQYKKIKILELKGMMNANPILFDLRSLLDPVEVRANGFDYRTL